MKELVYGKLREEVRWKLVELPRRAVVGGIISGLHQWVKVREANYKAKPFS